MLSHRQLHGLLVEVLNRSRRVAARDDTERRVLNLLKGLNGRRRGVWRPDGGGKVDGGLDQALEGGSQGLLCSSPRGAGGGLEDGDFPPCLSRHFLAVGGEGEMRVKRNAQDARAPVEGDGRAARGDVWVEV